MNLSLKLLPPSPVSCRAPLDVRFAWKGCEPASARLVRRNGEKSECRELAFSRNGEWASGVLRLDLRNAAGWNELRLELLDAAGAVIAERGAPLEVLDLPERSTGLLGGAWCGLYHWSETEGRLWNRELKEFTADDWRRLAADMHRAGLDVIVIQELFRNEMYYGRHSIPAEGYRGRAFYPSELFPGRMEIACADPVEALLSAADELGMAVLPGIGMYAWFDFTPGSFDWHAAVAEEVFRRYGHHPSLYGWYISEEVFGNLHYGPGTEEDIAAFFRRFRALRDRLDPAMPVMLAPNSFDVPAAHEAWNRLAAELDIICPFGFNRMGPEDLPPREAAALFRRIADENNAHLWFDMEIFHFTGDQALVPRPIAEIEAELAAFPEFEKVLCYQFPGLMNAPDAGRRPGGPATVELYRGYLAYRERRRRPC